MSEARTNWGRWGEFDERGTANLLGSETVIRATRRVRSGRVYGLSIPIRKDAPSAGEKIPPVHLMAMTGGDFASVGKDYGAAEDYILLSTHGTTHIDALSHVWRDNKMYNGYPSTEIRSSGSGACAIDKAGPFVTTAHLLDFVTSPPRDGVRITPQDLEDQLAAAHEVVEPGDALLLRTGWIEDALAKKQVRASYPAADPSIAEWVAEHDVCIVGADNLAVEALTPGTRLPLPLHSSLITELGVYLIELMHLAGPAADGVTSGLFMVAPLSISRGVGSPVTPVLIA